MSEGVVVTGVGIVSPAGVGAMQSWRALLDGVRTVGPLERQAAPGRHRWIGAVVPEHRPPTGMTRRDRVCRLAVAAAEEAVLQAGLGTDPVGNLSPDRVAACVGTSKGGILTLSAALQAMRRTSARRSGPRRPGLPADLAVLLPDIPPDGPARAVAERYGLQGGALADVAACATGTSSIIRGAQLIVEGRADRVLCGGSDASLAPLWLAAFDRMGVLAGPHPELGAAWACRPFDATREGFVPGEGAAILVLETRRGAAARGAPILAEISGWACATDPAGLTATSADAASLEYAFRTACRRASVDPCDIRAIHAHGTGTRSNDAYEALAIAALLGSQTTRVPVLSIKGAIGHLLGAAGAVETAIACLSVAQGRQPGLSTLLEPDPRLPPLYWPRDQVELEPGAVLKISMGFGGHIAVLVVSGGSARGSQTADGR